MWINISLVRYHNLVHKLTTHRGRPLAMSVYQKNEAKETSFRRQKIDQLKKLNGNLYFSKSFLRSIFVKTSTFFALLHIFQFNLLMSLTASAIFELSWLGVICDFSDTFLQSWVCTTLRSTRRRGVISVWWQIKRKFYWRTDESPRFTVESIVNLTFQTVMRPCY